MIAHPLLAFDETGTSVLWVAWVTLALLIIALLAAAASNFFRSVAHFDDDLREATMDSSPEMRRRFFELYESRGPRNPAVAWFLSVALGPFGVNLYCGNVGLALGAAVSLNGLGVWWMESWFSAPQLVLMRNRALIAWTAAILSGESQDAAETPVHETTSSLFAVGSVA